VDETWHARDNPVVTSDNTTAEEPPFVDPTPKGTPGAIVVWSGSEPCVRALPLERGAVTLGRDLAASLGLSGEWLSGEHCEIRRRGDGWIVKDLGSRNGTFLNGEALRGEKRAENSAIVRAGQLVMLLLDDSAALASRTELRVGNFVVGPLRAKEHQEIALAADEGVRITILGESGAGKEQAARVAHEHGPHPDGEFVAVNCATLNPNLAAADLFGCEKGAHSMAHMRMKGKFHAANGGTLFLDEIGELPLEAQAMLLRVLDSGQVLRVGALEPEQLDVRVVFATNVDLRRAKDEGTFRKDLYYRISQAVIHLAPLGDRPEEIPFLVRKNLPGTPEPTARLVEACMLRKWEGNMRELENALGHARRMAKQTGAPQIVPEHLPKDPTTTSTTPAKSGKTLEESNREHVLAAMEEHGGNVTEAAKHLGLSRPSLYRLLEKYGVTKS